MRYLIMFLLSLLLIAFGSGLIRFVGFIIAVASVYSYLSKVGFI
ncbi:MAG: hypothetical protein ACP5JU_03625 [Minisyncoccia bacterium]